MMENQYNYHPIPPLSLASLGSPGIPAVQLGGCMKCANREMRCPDPTLMTWTTGSSDLGKMAMSWLFQSFQWNKFLWETISGRMIQNEKDRWILWILWYLWYPGKFMRQWPYLVRSSDLRPSNRWENGCTNDHGLNKGQCLKITLTRVHYPTGLVLQNVGLSSAVKIWQTIATAERLLERPATLAVSRTNSTG